MKKEYQQIIDLLNLEVKPALGCTEPIAVALAVARSCEELRKAGEDFEKIQVEVSCNILKNGMGVGIPCTGMVGLHIAAALGATCGNSAYKLQVLQELDKESIARAKALVEQDNVEIKLAETDLKLFIKATCTSKNHSASTTISNIHDNIVRVTLDGKTIYCSPGENNETPTEGQQPESPKLSIEIIYDFATNIDFEDIKFILSAAQMNSRISQEGLKNDYGLQVGKTIFNNMSKNIFGNNIMTYSMALTAAASDARMAGSMLPAMSNSGSGNQGITATMPVVATAEKLGSSPEQLARALIISHLVSIHIKKSLGRLSALCGCVVASSGSACGIVYLMGGGYDQMTYAIKNMIGNVTGMVCDGAKVGCAMKVSSGVSAAIQSAMLAIDNICISGNDGIIDSDVEKTILNLSLIGTEGMATTDKLMIDIMVNKNRC